MMNGLVKRRSHQAIKLFFLVTQKKQAIKEFFFFFTFAEIVSKGRNAEHTTPNQSGAI